MNFNNNNKMKENLFQTNKFKNGTTINFNMKSGDYELIGELPEPFFSNENYDFYLNEPANVKENDNRIFATALHKNNGEHYFNMIFEPDFKNIEDNIIFVVQIFKTQLMIFTKNGMFGVTNQNTEHQFNSFKTTGDFFKHYENINNIDDLNNILSNENYEIYKLNNFPFDEYKKINKIY